MWGGSLVGGGRCGVARDYTSVVGPPGLAWSLNILPLGMTEAGASTAAFAFAALMGCGSTTQAFGMDSLLKQPTINTSEYSQQSASPLQEESSIWCVLLLPHFFPTHHSHPSHSSLSNI